MLPIKINRTTITIAVLVILLAALGVQTIRASRFKIKATIAENERDQVATLTNELQSEITKYQNENGNTINQVRTLQLTLDNLERLKESERLSFLKQFANLKKDLRNLESAGSFEWLIVEDSVPSSVVYIPCKDSVKVFHYLLQDEFNTIDAMVIDTPKVKIRVPFYPVVLWDRKKWLGMKIGKKVYYNESYSPNQLVDITRQELIRVEKRVKN